MRFHIGFSQRLPVKWILLIFGALLAFFGIDKLTASALIVNTGAESVRTCPYNDVFTSPSCVVQQSIQCQTGYGLANCYAATTSNTTMAQKSTWYHFVTNTSNSNCNTSQSVSFNASVILNQNIGLNGDNTNNWFDPNALNYPVWQTTPTTRNSNLKSVKENVNTRALFTGYWPYLADWTGTRNENKNGVRLYWKTPNNTFGDTYCNFLSYGNNNLTLNYSCTAPAKQLYYQVGINQYNNAGGLSSSNIYSEASLKISGVSDPCASGGSSGGTFDDSNIVEAINDNTLNTSNAIDGLTDAVNSATSDIMDKQDLTNDKLDEVNDNLEAINGSIDRLTCNKVYGNSNSSTNGKYLNSSGVVSNAGGWMITDFVQFSSIKEYYGTISSAASICYYDNLKTLLSCQTLQAVSSNGFSFPKTAVYFRSSMSPLGDRSFIEYCTNFNGNTPISDYEGAITPGSGHFSDILYAPIRLLEAIRGDEPDPSLPLTRDGSNQCTGLSLPITMGSHSETVVVPCGDGFWAEWPWQIVLLYQTVVFGYLGYRILLYLVKYFNDLANPHDLNEISDFTVKHF